MFRGSCVSGLTVFVLAAALLAHPSEMLAQRGAGGGHTGGGVESGESLSSIGKATGVDVKDDLKDFHEMLAVQATSQQIVAYAAMLKTTAAASAELKTLLDQLGKQSSQELASRVASLNQAIEAARTEEKKFLDGFSDRQKSGLKEITKKLLKADADLAQQARELDERVVDAKTPGPQIASVAQGLDQALTSFQTGQLDLGEEMSIAARNGEQAAFEIPPVRNSIIFPGQSAGQSVVVTASGVISRGVADNGQNKFKLELTADMSDLQHDFTEVLRSQLDKANRCGEQIAVQNAVLTPQEPAGLVVVQLHFERWACFGGQASEIAEGNGTVEMNLIPAVGNDGALHLAPKISRVDAEGLLGESLRSGSLGDILREKVSEAVLSAVRQGGDFKAILPPSAQGNVTLRRAEFEGTGAGKLVAVLDGDIRVSNENAAALTSELKASELKGRSASQSASQPAASETVPR
ncbi:MAG: hypothetical protein ABSA78_20810 [Candidatus Sulfotelmatobacter sp.]|jgi:hypothetical protein